jgi:hypothetical protein
MPGVDGAASGARSAIILLIFAAWLERFDRLTPNHAMLAKINVDPLSPGASDQHPISANHCA